MERFEEVMIDVSPNSPVKTAFDDLCDAFRMTNDREKDFLCFELSKVFSINGLSKLLKIKAENVSGD